MVTALEVIPQDMEVLVARQDSPHLSVYKDGDALVRGGEGNTH
jgi:hypothetical protein